MPTPYREPADVLAPETVKPPAVREAACPPCCATLHCRHHCTRTPRTPNPERCFIEQPTKRYAPPIVARAVIFALAVPILALSMWNRVAALRGDPPHPQRTRHVDSSIDWVQVEMQYRQIFLEEEEAYRRGDGCDPAWTNVPRISPGNAGTILLGSTSSASPVWVDAKTLLKSEGCGR